MTAFEHDKQRLAPLVNELQPDSKRIDRHFRTFKAMSVEPYTGPKLKAIAIDADWQADASDATAKTIKLGVSQIMDEDGIVLVPTSVAEIPSALQLIAKSGGKLAGCLAGLQPEAAVWYAVTFSKAQAKLDEALKVDLAGACDGGYDDVLTFISGRFVGASTQLSLS